MNAAYLTNTLKRAISFDYSGSPFEAEQLYRQLINHRPAVDMAHFMYAQFLLRQRRYDEAWPHFMHRLQDEVYQSKPQAQLNAVCWDDLNQEGISEQTLLIGCDQGIGDALMCARYIPETAKYFKTVVFMVFKGFRDLFLSLEDLSNVHVIEFEQSLPRFDLYIDVFSLPAVFKTTPDTIPSGKWMNPNSECVEKWRLEMDSTRMNVGITWQGNSLHSRDAERSAPLGDFLPILRCDVNYISLQVGEGLEQIEDLPNDVSLKNYESLTAQIDQAQGKMLESAALIKNLDLVIAVDTAVAHLAGSLGTPCWVLLPKVPCWRWMEDGDLSDWYATTRMFRPIKRYDRTYPISRMYERMLQIIEKDGKALLP